MTDNVIARMARLAATTMEVRGGQSGDGHSELIAAADEIERLEKHIGNLLARIHRDGGHYQAQHGTEKAVQDAEKICADWAEVLASRDAESGRLERELAEERILHNRQDKERYDLYDKSRCELAECQAQCAAMREALVRLELDCASILAGKPVRCHDETLAEVKSALSPDAGAKVLRVVEAAIAQHEMYPEHSIPVFREALAALDGEGK